MAEYKYVSLKEVLKDQTTPQLTLRGSDLESEDEPDYDLVSKSLGNPKFPSSPPFSLPGSCSDIPNKGKTKKVAEEKKSGFRASLKHSRSDDPLVYMKCDEDDVDANFDDSKTLRQEMKNFSWEERTLKFNILSDEEEK